MFAKSALLMRFGGESTFSDDFHMLSQKVAEIVFVFIGIKSARRQKDEGIVPIEQISFIRGECMRKIVPFQQRIVDVSGREEPMYLSRFDTAGTITDLVLSKDRKRLFLVDRNFGLVILDVEDPKIPRRLASFAMEGYLFRFC